MSSYESTMTFEQVYNNAVTLKGDRITGTSAIEHSELVFDYMVDHIDSSEYDHEYDHERMIEEFREHEDKQINEYEDELQELKDTIADLEKQVLELELDNDILTEQMRDLL